jgi:hypothetical protein
MNRDAKPATSGMPRKTSTFSGDLPDRDLQTLRVQAQPARQHGQVEPAQHREHHDLEDRVDRDQHRGRLPVTAREIVPDHDHRDAAGETHDDQPGPVLRQVGRKIHASANITAGPTSQFSSSEETEASCRP